MTWNWLITCTWCTEMYMHTLCTQPLHSILITNNFTTNSPALPASVTWWGLRPTTKTAVYWHVTPSIMVGIFSTFRRKSPPPTIRFALSESVTWWGLRGTTKTAVYWHVTPCIMVGIFSTFRRKFPPPHYQVYTLSTGAESSFKMSTHLQRRRTTSRPGWHRS